MDQVMRRDVKALQVYIDMLWMGKPVEISARNAAPENWIKSYNKRKCKRKSKNMKILEILSTRLYQRWSVNVRINDLSPGYNLNVTQIIAILHHQEVIFTNSCPHIACCFLPKENMIDSAHLHWRSKSPQCQKGATIYPNSGVFLTPTGEDENLMQYWPEHPSWCSIDAVLVQYWPEQQVDAVLM